MGFLKKQPDPISQRAQHLNTEIARLEAQIKELSRQSPRDPEAKTRPPQTAPSQPVFEDVSNLRTAVTPKPGEEDPHYNELGVRKFDLVGAVERFRRLFSGPPPGNPQLVNFMAAGSIQGLRPLRYEKRKARKRFLTLFGLLAAALYGVVYFFLKRR